MNSKPRNPTLTDQSDCFRPLNLPPPQPPATHRMTLPLLWPASTKRCARAMSVRSYVQSMTARNRPDSARSTRCARASAVLSMLPATTRLPLLLVCQAARSSPPEIGNDEQQGPARSEARRSAFKGGVPDAIHDDVVGLPLEQEILRCIVDHPVGAERGDQLAVGAAAHTGDSRAHLLGELHRRRAHGTGCAVHEHGAAQFDRGATEKSMGGGPAGDESHGIREGHVPWLRRDRAILRDADVFRVPAESAAEHRDRLPPGNLPGRGAELACSRRTRRTDPLHPTG